MVTGFIHIHFSTPLLHISYPSSSIYQPTIYLPIYPVITNLLTHPPTHLFIIHLPTYQPTQSSIYLPIHSHNIYLYAYLAICPSAHLFVHPTIPLFTYLHIYPPMVIYLAHAYPHPPTHLYIHHPPTHLYIHPHIHYSAMHTPIHSSIIHPPLSSHLHTYHSNLPSVKHPSIYLPHPPICPFLHSFI